MGYLYVAQVSIPKEYEAEMNRLYDDEHIPNLMTLPGLRSARRYKLAWGDPDMPAYLAVYELDDPTLPQTAAWKAASDKGEWSVKIRPRLTVRLHGMFEQTRAWPGEEP
jgi:hypothetical protein